MSPHTTTEAEHLADVAARLDRLDLGEPFRWEVTVNHRRRTRVGIKIEPGAGNTVHVDLPPGISPDDAAELVRRERTWITRTVTHMRTQTPISPPIRRGISGETFDWLGRPHPLRPTNIGSSFPATFRGGSFLVPPDPPKPASAIIAAYRRDGLTWTIKRAKPWTRLLGLQHSPPSYAVADLGKCCWGIYENTHRISP
ncbi:YgjP-like metallopeptidase domain-containing protein [Embleya sp. NPDC059237]|uniref:YgjP-like metallopeptidase domain-containing protein n=1 Tax=Embleya sp. NPDC059237 TaxID=3346784 RepID=UPI0036B80BE7